jgi:ketosteroid isomerase-like protein
MIFNLKYLTTKGFHTFLTALLIFSFACICCCRIKQNVAVFNENEEIQLVKQAIDNVIGWAVTKDFDLFFNTIADDSNFISVTPEKKVKFGIDDVKKDTGFWASPNFKAERHKLRDLQIHFSGSKDVAWFFCYLDDINEWKGQPANWENIRWTGTLEKRKGKWRVVQQHYSFATE